MPNPITFSDLKLMSAIRTPHEDEVTLYGHPESNDADYLAVSLRIHQALDLYNALGRALGLR